MNTRILTAACAAMLLVAVANAQTSSPAERKDTTGTISDYTPDRALVLSTETSGGEPLQFRFAQKVTYVDNDGKTIEAPGLRKNLRVRVSYLKVGGDLVVDKVTILE